MNWPKIFCLTLSFLLFPGSVFSADPSLLEAIQNIPVRVVYQKEGGEAEMEQRGWNKIESTAIKIPSVPVKATALLRAFGSVTVLGPPSGGHCGFRFMHKRSGGEEKRYGSNVWGDALVGCGLRHGSRDNTKPHWCRWYMERTISLDKGEHEFWLAFIGDFPQGTTCYMGGGTYSRPILTIEVEASGKEFLEWAALRK